MSNILKSSPLFRLDSKSQIFFWALIAFILGVALRSFVIMPNLSVWAFFILGTACIAAGFFKIHMRPKLFFYGLFVLAFALGMLRHLQKSETVSQEIARLAGQRVSLVGVVGDEPVRKAKSQELVVKIGNDSGQKVLAIVRTYPEFYYGDEIKISGILEEPANFSKDFDYRAYLAKDDIFYVMKLPAIEHMSSGNGNPFYQNLLVLKQRFTKNLTAFVPEPEASFLDGLILGERRTIPADVLDAFSRTGTTHIVALSGYNITIVASAFMRTLAFFSFPFVFNLWLSAVGIALFTILTGASASVVRASIMGLLVLLAQGGGRIYNIRNALTLAAAVMTFQNPAILRFDTSFQLSFLATAGLIYVSPLFERWFRKCEYRIKIFLRNKGVRSEARDKERTVSGAHVLKGIFISTLSAQLFVLPLLMYNFGRLSLVSPVANLLVLPFVPLAMLLGFLSASAGFFSSFLSEMFGWAGWAVAHYQLSAVMLLSRVPGASLEITALPDAALVMMYLVIAAWFAWSRKSAKKYGGNA